MFLILIIYLFILFFFNLNWQILALCNYFIVKYIVYLKHLSINNNYILQLVIFFLSENLFMYLYIKWKSLEILKNYFKIECLEFVWNRKFLLYLKRLIWAIFSINILLMFWNNLRNFTAYSIIYEFKISLFILLKIFFFVLPRHFDETPVNCNYMA